MRGGGGLDEDRAVRLLARLLLPVLLALAVLAPVAGAAEVSYVDGGQVWIATLDGAQKRSLSGPSPDAKVWTEAAQADNGTVIGVRREPGKMATLNATRLWGAGGNLIGEGALTAPTGRTLYAFPVTLDLTPDGQIVVYGYANSSGFGLEQSFEFGTYAEGSSNWYIQPFDIGEVKSGTLAGNRVVGVSGATVGLQDASGQPPYSHEFKPWLGGEEIDRVDVAANGKIAAVELGPYAETKVAMIPFPSLGGAFPADGSDCFLPTQGDAGEVSIAPDGSRMAWRDSRGVVVAGTPVWFPSMAVSTCNLSAPPVVISATGRMPSIGGSTAALAGAGGGGGGKGGSGKRPRVVALAKKPQAKALKAGIPLTVSVAAAGKVTALGKLGRKTVAKGSATAKRAGEVKLKLKATKAYRDRLAQLVGKRLKISVSGPGGKTSLTRKLR
jgi:hypothetical protein